jgi:hypothetical protein
MILRRITFKNPVMYSVKLSPDMHHPKESGQSPQNAPEPSCIAGV